MEQLKEQLRMRKFANNFITIPCLMLSAVMLIIAPNPLWMIIAAFNFILMLMNFSLINTMENSIASGEESSEKMRQRRLKELYGESDE